MHMRFITASGLPSLLAAAGLAGCGRTSLSDRSFALQVRDPDVHRQPS